MEILRNQPKQGKQRKQSSQKLSLTPEIQALYFQCLAGRHQPLSTAEQQLVIQVFDRQFPALKRAAKASAQKAPLLYTIGKTIYWICILSIVGLMILVLLGLNASADDTWPHEYESAEQALSRASNLNERAKIIRGKEEALQQGFGQLDKQAALQQQSAVYQQQLETLQQAYKQAQAQHTAQMSELERRQREAELLEALEAQKDKAALDRLQMSKQLAAVNAELIQAAQEQAQDSEREAWRQGREHQQQPVNTLTGADGSTAVFQNAPRQIVMTPDGPGLSERHTTIKVFQPAPVIQQLPGMAKIRNTTEGTDHSNSLDLSVDVTDEGQLDLLGKQIDGNNQRFQQRLELEAISLNNAFWLQAVKQAKSLILWGLLVSIPFLAISYLIAKNALSGISHHRQAMMKEESRQYELLAAGDREHETD